MDAPEGIKGYDGFTGKLKAKRTSLVAALGVLVLDGLVDRVSDGKGYRYIITEQGRDAAESGNITDASDSQVGA